MDHAVYRCLEDAGEVYLCAFDAGCFPVGIHKSARQDRRNVTTTVPRCGLGVFRLRVCCTKPLR